MNHVDRVALAVAEGQHWAVLAGPPQTAASHRAAAVLHGTREGTPVELTVPAGTHAIRGVVVHRGGVDASDRSTVTCIPATRIDRTLVDLAAAVMVSMAGA